jgi:hypothetical protein
MLIDRGNVMSLCQVVVVKIDTRVEEGIGIMMMQLEGMGMVKGVDDMNGVVREMRGEVVVVDTLQIGQCLTHPCFRICPHRFVRDVLYTPLSSVLLK